MDEPTEVDDTNDERLERWGRDMALCAVCTALGIEPDHAPYENPRLGDVHHGQYDPEHPEDVRYDPSENGESPTVLPKDTVGSESGQPIRLGPNSGTFLQWEYDRQQRETLRPTRSSDLELMERAWNAGRDSRSDPTS